MDHLLFNWNENRKANLVERLYRGGSYEDFLEANISVIYAYTNEYGPYGNCIMIDKNENIYHCEFSKGILNGDMIISKYDELIGVYHMENGRIDYHKRKTSVDSLVGHFAYIFDIRICKDRGGMLQSHFNRVTITRAEHGIHTFWPPHGLFYTLKNAPTATAR